MNDRVPTISVRALFFEQSWSRNSVGIVFVDRRPNMRVLLKEVRKPENQPSRRSPAGNPAVLLYQSQALFPAGLPEVLEGKE